MESSQRDKAREKAREILGRMKSDPGFIQQLRDDPRATLAAAGMPADVLDEAVEGLGLGPEVAGHGRKLGSPQGPQSIWAAPDQTIWGEAQEASEE